MKRAQRDGQEITRRHRFEVRPKTCRSVFSILITRTRLSLAIRLAWSTSSQKGGDISRSGSSRLPGYGLAEEVEQVIHELNERGLHFKISGKLSVRGSDDIWHLSTTTRNVIPPVRISGKPVGCS